MQGQWFSYKNEDDELFELWISPTLAKRFDKSMPLRAYAYAEISKEMAAWRAMKMEAAMRTWGRA